MRHVLVGLSLGLMLVAPAAHAQTLLNEPFSGSASVLNFNAFENWNVRTGTTVDLIRSGDFGIVCAGSSGYCVDMSGSSGVTSNGGLETRLAYSFGVGDRMSFEVQVAGNQRQGPNDSFSAFLRVVSPVAFSEMTHSYGTLDVPFGPGAITEFTSMSGDLASTDPFRTWRISFTAASAGSAYFGFFTGTTDQIGPIVDNVRITRTVASVGVPEPGSLALIGAGLLGLAGRLRRRRTA